MFNSIKKKVISNIYLFSIFTKILLLVVGMLNSILLARFLGAELKGQYAYIGSINALITIFLVFGIHQAYPHFRKKYGAQFRDKYLGSISFLILSYSIIVFIIVTVLDIDSRWIAIVIMAPVLSYSKIIGYIALVDSPGMKNIVETVVNLFDLLFLGVLFICFDATYFWMVCLILIKDLLLCFIYSYRLKIRPKLSRGSLKLLFKLLKYGFIPMLSLLMTNLNYRVDVLMLKSLESYNMIGIYSIGVTLAEKCWLIPETIRDILVSRLVSGKTEEEVQKVIRYSITITLSIFLLVLLGGKYFIEILYGTEYQGAFNVTIVIILGVIGMVYTKMIAAYNLVNNCQYINMIILFVSVVVNIICNYIMIPIWGILGASYATLISYNICGFLFIFYFMKKTKVKLKNMLLLNKSDVTEILKLIRK